MPPSPKGNNTGCVEWERERPLTDKQSSLVCKVREKSIVTVSYLHSLISIFCLPKSDTLAWRKCCGIRYFCRNALYSSILHRKQWSILTLLLNVNEVQYWNSSSALAFEAEPTCIGASIECSVERLTESTSGWVSIRLIKSFWRIIIQESVRTGDFGYLYWIPLWLGSHNQFSSVIWNRW